jgi:hypothetical protein
VIGTRPRALAERVDAVDWGRVECELDARGCATTGPLLSPAECAALVAGYEAEEAFRKRVVMDRHGYGRGEYKYFAYPLPEAVAALREALYARLAPVANRWDAAVGGAGDFPAAHGDFVARCHAAGQARPTPLMLKYGADDFNCLHQDLYGALAFPLQVAFLLSRPGDDFSGGELVLTEQRARRQSRVEVVALAQGEGAIFAVNRRPVAGKRGPARVAMRHGVSRVRAGSRFTLGIIFHDAA